MLKVKYALSLDSTTMDGLNSGVPTQTTDTLTPTTLRNIQQTFLDQCNVEPHQNEARFVPPVVQPSNQVLSKPNGFSVIDTKSWHGGSARISDQPPVVHELSKVSPQPRRSGGRRPTKDKSISPEEEQRRAMRRERNKLAAARCRKRRLDHTNELILETDGLQEKKLQLQNEIKDLTSQKEELEYILQVHKPCCRLSSSMAPPSPPDIKPFVIDEIKPDPEEPEALEKKTIIKRTGTRPNSLPVSAPHVFSTPALPVTEVAGVPITTPTSGMTSFNFDSLMEGGTGLTPVSGPLMVPSCSTQQRNIGTLDLSSPDSGKLVSL